VGEWSSRLAEVSQPRAPAPLSGDDIYFMYIQCTGCKYRDQCPHYDSRNPGCMMRRSLFETQFAKIEFKSDDPLAINRLRLMAQNYVQILLMRSFGEGLTSEEIMLLKTVLDQLSRLGIDKTGELLDQKSKSAVPWDKDETVQKLKDEVEEARALKDEVDRLRAIVAKRERKQEVDAVADK
jgi:hypothetical protein